MIDELCCDYGYYRLRTYRENIRRDYLNLAKCKKRTAKKIRKAIKQQLQYMRRNFGYMEYLLSEGAELLEKRRKRCEVLWRVYEQQRYMCMNDEYRFKTAS